MQSVHRGVVVLLCESAEGCGCVVGVGEPGVGAVLELEQGFDLILYQLGVEEMPRVCHCAITCMFVVALNLWFQPLVFRDPACHACFRCFSAPTHLIQMNGSLPGFC